MICYCKDVLDSSLDIIKSCTASAFYLSASGFHYTIADPLMGGVYMTLLNSGLSPPLYNT